MRRKYCNWIAGKDILQDTFENSILNCGEVRICTILNHVSKSGMTRYISAYVPVVIKEEDGSHRAEIVCIAKEARVSGCGMDMGFHLAYNLFNEVYSDKNKPYQRYLRHNWL